MGKRKCTRIDVNEPKSKQAHSIPSVTPSESSLSSQLSKEIDDLIEEVELTLIPDFQKTTKLAPIFLSPHSRVVPRRSSNSPLHVQSISPPTPLHSNQPASCKSPGLISSSKVDPLFPQDSHSYRATSSSLPSPSHPAPTLPHDLPLGLPPAQLQVNPILISPVLDFPFSPSVIPLEPRIALRNRFSALESLDPLAVSFTPLFDTRPSVTDKTLSISANLVCAPRLLGPMAKIGRASCRKECRL